MPLILDEIHWDTRSFLICFAAAMIFFIYLMRQLKVEKEHLSETIKRKHALGDALGQHLKDTQAFTEEYIFGKSAATESKQVLDLCDHVDRWNKHFEATHMTDEELSVTAQRQPWAFLCDQSSAR